jgi:hypothetical protein
MQQKTRLPVQFEITEQTRDRVENWSRAAGHERHHRTQPLLQP